MTRTGDLAANVAAHAALVRATPADLWVFPELSLTGYDLTAPSIDTADPVLRPLQRACAGAATTVLAGSPVSEGGDRYIAMLVVRADRVEVAYRKRWLGPDEAAGFRAGDEPTLVAVAGWRVAVGICKDTGTAEHVAGVAALAPDLYVAGVVHHATERVEQDRRGRHLARACRAPVAFASFAGPTAEGYDRTAGCSTIWDSSGEVEDRAGDGPGEVVTARLTRPG